MPSLPPVVALFDDTIVYEGFPTVMDRYMLLETHPFGDSTMLQPVLDISLHTLTKGTFPPTLAVNQPELIRISSMVDPVRSLLTHVWYTGEVVSKAPRMNIPVIDLEHRNLLREAYSYRVHGDTLEDCRRRQTAQRNTRLGFYAQLSPLRLPRLRRQLTIEIPSDPVLDIDTVVSPHPMPSLDSPLQPRSLSPPPPPPPAVQTVQQVPRFIAALIKKEAVATGASCPITLNPIVEEMPCKVTSCFHLFEATALDQWLIEKNTCPACKATVSSITDI